MDLQTIHSWTLFGLIGAFLDLTLAYFLLCGSAFAYFASKFLGVFGLYLPCSCNGPFGFLNSNQCLHRLLFDCPRQKIHSVQLLAMSRFPFDFNSTWMRDQVAHLNVKLMKSSKCSDGVLELEGEAYFSSCSGPKSCNLVVREVLPRIEMLGIEENKSGAKGEEVMNQKQRCGVRRRRRASIEYVGDVSHSPYNSAEIAKQMNGTLRSVNTGEDDLYDDEDAPTIIDLGETTPHGFELSGSFDETNGVGSRDLPSWDGFVSKTRDNLGCAGYESNAVRILEQQREELQATRDALYLELEKERAAAATAADEAMTMILRLQKEKASVEMEARQYERMIEEKSAFDEEEMNILKEIIVRREREKHFLENELEMYQRVMSVGYEHLEGDMQDKMDKWGQLPAYSFAGEDPIETLQHTDFSEFISKKEIGEKLNQSPNYEDLSAERQGCLDGCNIEFPERKKNNRVCQEMTTKAAQCCSSIGKSSCDGEDLEKYGEYNTQLDSNLHTSVLDLVPNVHNIHVINDKTKVWNEESGPSMCCVLDQPRESVYSVGASGVHSGEVLSNCPCTSMPEAVWNTHESSLEVSGKSQEVGDSQGKALLFDSGRNSLSAVDNERLNTDSEVEWLRARLRIVDEGRKKLSFSSQHNEGEEAQLKLLEEIAHQLQEIRQLTEPVEVTQQASLPSRSSKASLR